MTLRYSYRGALQPRRLFCQIRSEFGISHWFCGRHEHTFLVFCPDSGVSYCPDCVKVRLVRKRKDLGILP